MTTDMITCPTCNWAHRSPLAAAECQEQHDLETAEHEERFGSGRE